MNKKILSAVLAAAAVLNTGVYAAYNKYNEEPVYNMTNATMDEVAESMGTGFEDIKADFGLPEDMAADTNETIAFGYLSLKNMAKMYGEDETQFIADVVSLTDGSMEITPDSLWKDVEGHFLLKNYIADMTMEDFKAQYLPDVEVNETTLYGDVKYDVGRAMMEEAKVIPYFNKEDSILVMVNGKYVDFDVPPAIINDRTMVPLRYIFESMGAVVNWDGETKTIFINKDEKIITLQIGLDRMFVNSEVVELDTAPQIVDDRTLVPLAAIAEALDTQVFYNELTKTVVVH